MTAQTQSRTRWIDGLNEGVGRLASWLVFVVVLIGGFNAIVRYTARFTHLNISANIYLELQWYLFSAMFLLGGAYTLKRDEHVRVDVFLARMNRRRKAMIDVAGTILFLIPFCIFVIWSSWFPVYNSWAILEKSPDPGGLPRYPVKTLIPLAFFLLLLQAIAFLIRRLRDMREARGAEAAS